MAITTKQGYLRKKGTSGQDEMRYAVKTLASLITDVDRNQTLAVSLANMIERNALGYPVFSTLTSYATDDEVYYDRKLWKFTSAHQGAWDANDVREFSVKEYMDALSAHIGYYECDTASATAAKTISASGFVLKTGGAFKIKMTHANSATSPTLNINNTGATSLYYDGAIASPTNTWEDGETLDVYFDGTNYMANNVSGGGKFKGGEKVKDVDIANYAKIDGKYPAMTVGLSENFEGDVEDEKKTYLLRPTGGDKEIANGQAKTPVALYGNAVGWNQLVAIPASDVSKTVNNVTITDNRDGSYTVQTTNEGASYVTSLELPRIVATGGHKYLIYGCPTGGSDSSYFVADTNGCLYGREYGSGVILTALSSGNVNLSIIVLAATIIKTPITFRPQIIDLTLLNSELANKANLTVADVEEYLANELGEKPYYPQNAGTLLPAIYTGQKSLSTPNLLNSTTKQARLFAYTYPSHDNEYTIKALPSDAAIKFVADKVGDNLPEVTNLVTNGDFSDGTTGWGGTASPSVTNKIASFTTGQLTQNISIINGHKYLFGIYAKTIGTYNSYFATSSSAFASGAYPISNVDYAYTKAIMTATAEGRTLKIASATGATEIHLTNVSLIDLTAIFGAGNEPITVAEAELALFGKITPDANDHFVIPSQGVAEIVNASNYEPYSGTGNLATTWLVATWDGSKDNYDENFEPFNEESRPFDVRNIYNDNNGVKTQVCPTGMKMADFEGTVRDALIPNIATGKWEFVQNVGDQDLGAQEMTYTYFSSYLTFQTGLPNYKLGSLELGRGICAQYKVMTQSAFNANPKPNLAISGNNSVTVFIRNTDFDGTTAEGIAAFKASINGVHIYYILATPITYTNLYYKTGEDTYVPLEQVFPISTLVNNCAYEAAEVTPFNQDGQPTSCAACLSSVYNKDYKELLNTLEDEQATNVDDAKLYTNLDALCAALQTAGIVASYTITQGTDGNCSFTFTTPN